MIDPRATRLVRTPDLHGFRAALVAAAGDGPPLAARDRLVIVPTHAARTHLIRSIENAALHGRDAVVLPEIAVPEDLPLRFALRLPDRASPLLSPAEREVLLAASCRAAIAGGAVPPFQLRPGLVAEILVFYDTLLRNQKTLDTFERLALGVLDQEAIEDRGAERLAQQTRFLSAAFRHFERCCASTGAADEHLLRRQVMATAAAQPWRHVIVAVGDVAAERHGLTAADWDLLARVPGLERLDVVVTESRIAGGLHERMHRWLPGIEEVRFNGGGPVPALLTASADQAIQVTRDREEEVAAFGRWVRALSRADDVALDRIALVVRRPLPYVYVTREVLSSGGVPCQMFDALPLAAEPYSAALDLVFSCIRAQAARGPAIALLQSPHFLFADAAGEPLSRRALAALDRALSEAGYLGELAALQRLIGEWREAPTRRAAAREAGEALLAIAEELEPLRQPASGAVLLDGLLAFLRRHERLPGPDDPLRTRQLRARAAVTATIVALRDAHAAHDAEPIDFDTAAGMIRRWIDGQTFAPRDGASGVHLVDADSAAFGDFACVQLGGLVDGEWPERPRRNIFYPASILRDLGWPSEADRLEAERAAFRDLLGLPARLLTVSGFMLEDEALVSPSSLVEEIDALPLPKRLEAAPRARVFSHEAMAVEPMRLDVLPPSVQARARRRVGLAATRALHASGRPAGHVPAGYSVSSLERYQDCPFKYFAADVLSLEEPPEDEASLSPRARGRFIHEVFQRFFAAWDERAGGTITAANIEAARALFEEVAAGPLAALPDADASLERARLFGSAIATGIVDVVLGLEASRPAVVTRRWLEYRLEGDFSLGSSDGTRVRLRGVADRIDLLAGDRLRVIDYKSGVAPQPARALQAPVYALCARERLDGEGRACAIDEAAYVAFSGKRTLVPVIRSGTGDADATLTAVRERLFDLANAVGRGEFPPRPYETRICGYCAFPSVCRKDYVGDE